MQNKKTTANHAAAISHKHCPCEAVLEKLDCLSKGGDSRVSGCTRLNYRVMLTEYKRIETFHVHFE